MRDSTLSKIDILFKHRTKKGSTGSVGIIEMLDAKAFFPKVDVEDIVDLWAFCQSNGYKIENISRLSTIEQQGFKVAKGVVDSALGVKEQSLYEKRKKEELLFDISKTTLPFRLSRAYQIKNFKSTSEFSQQIKGSYFTNRGLKLVKSETDMSSVDFYNKTVFYAFSPGRDELGSILRAIVLAESAKTQENYDEALNNKAKGAILRTQIALVSNAVLSSVGLEEQKSRVSPDFKKNYIWGRDVADVFANVNALANAVARVMYVSDLEACFFKECARQNDIKKEASLRSVNTIDYNSLNQALDDERSRVKEVIKSSVDIAEVIRDFGEVDILNDGANFKSLCVSPSHDDTKPSLKISSSKGVCNCVSCEFSGDAISVVMSTTGIGYKDAIDEIARKYGINTNYDFIKSQFNMKKSKEDFVQRIVMKYKEDISDREYNSLLNMNISSLKAYDINKSLELEKAKTYEVKKQNMIEPAAKQVNSYILNSYELTTDANALRYIQEQRGLKEFPNELKVLNCKHTYDNGNVTSHSLVGFINSKNGCDGKYFVGEAIGRPRSIGEKAITVLNEHNLQKSNPNFIIAESQWDMVALYNDDIGRNVYENSVGIILNGTAMTDEAKMFINEHKGRYSGLIVLNQADEPNQKAMNNIVFGTGITKHTHVSYTDEEAEAKADLNDLHKAGEFIGSRFSSKLTEYESDVVLTKNNIRDYS